MSREDQSRTAPASGATIALFVPCLTDTFFPRAAIAMVRVLEHLGYQPAFPKMQTCCGQPFFNGGHHPEARTLIERMAGIFAPFDLLVTPSGSCASFVREHALTMYNEAPDPIVSLARKTLEFVEFLSDVLRFDPSAHGVTWSGTVACHDACHLRPLGLMGCNESLLTDVDGLTVLPNERPEECCGFGGMFATKFATVSSGLAHKRVHHLTTSGAETIVCNDAGCAMNIRSAAEAEGRRLRFLSTAEIIAEGLGLLDPEGER